ncbi:hypothetical protein [Bradyrhizobium sp. dw_411]|uniref:hypothetical protein n=1 Tax=Bradyrhizobium sp. dw_411 TaxID=2720082 RepID=UPI001BCCD72D|nr:hypothetical protein [Bradyrhizobium sp. dw_411]
MGNKRIHVARLDQLADRRRLSAEAATLAEAYGPNAYSDYLLNHGCRPNRKTAATIGRLIGVRVKAADGTMQPPRSKADKLARAELHRKWDHIARLRSALAQLALNEDAPESIIDSIVSADRAEISKNLEKAVKWLIRLSDYWQCHGTEERPQATHSNSRRIFRPANIRAANDS